MKKPPSFFLLAAVWLAMTAAAFVLFTPANTGIFVTLAPARATEAPTAPPTPNAAAPTDAPRTAFAPTPAPTASPTPEVTTAPTPTPDPTEVERLSYDAGGLKIVLTKHEKEGNVLFSADIRVDSAEQFRSAFASGERPLSARAYVSKIAAKTDAVLACNGDYVGYRSDGIAIRNGELLRNQPGGTDLLIVDAQGNLDVMPERRADGEALLDAGVWQTFSFGPELVTDGVAQTEFPRRLVSDKYKEPRTAIGQIAPLHYLLLVVDGRREGYSEGMTLDELALEMASRGCRVAYNLDGGGSTTLFFNGEVINRPSGNGERSVTDILYFAEEVTPGKSGVGG